MKSRQWLIHHHRLYPGYVWDREREEIKFVAENILNQYKIIPTRMCSPVEGQAIRSFGTDHHNSQYISIQFFVHGGGLSHQKGDPRERYSRSLDKCCWLGGIWNVNLNREYMGGGGVGRTLQIHH